ncbi:hypothetical protein GQ600_12860 [Phytophthora cactorum]|nr:hypothetical protein GQ600_12860 [Phytophthora cactorum]
MSVTAADTTASLEGELQSAADTPDSSKPQRRQSKALSISSLSDERDRNSNTTATEACRDVERELAAIETRLSAFRGRRRRKNSESNPNAVAPLQNKMQDGISRDKTDEDSPKSPFSVSSNMDTSSPIFSKLSKAQQEAEAVAEQVATTLMKCDQLLQRAKSCASNASSAWDVKNTIEDEEFLLSRKAAAVKRLAVRCQRDIETSTTKIELHHQQTQAAYLKELQRKYDSKKHMTLMSLRGNHNAAMEESLSQLELQLITETERDKQELTSQLQEELSLRLKQIQDNNRSSLERWEVEQRQKLEQELYDHREAAVASVLKAQEERTAVLKQEIHASHCEKEETEIQKLHKALAFGAQAQLQQLRKLLETEHEEKMNDIKTEAKLSLEKETEELKKMLTRSHREQQEQLQRTWKRKIALNAHRQDFKLECRQELEILEQTLDQEMSTKLRQLETDHTEECELKLEQMRARAVNQHARELDAKRSRMIQCKNVLLAEATAFLTFDNNFSDEDRSKANPEDNSAAAHLLELKKHLSKELAQYVDVMVAEFDELAEEQRILVAKITESTQLYLSFKRQCGVLEAQSEELTSGLETLHDQLQKKDAVCKKLYQANEALLKRLQTPALQASVGSDKSDVLSPPVKRSPALTKALQTASNRHKLEMINTQSVSKTLGDSTLTAYGGSADDQWQAFGSPAHRYTGSSTDFYRTSSVWMVPKSAGATSVARRFRHSEVAMTSTWQQYENQTQRPSSSHVTPRDAPTERRTERLKDPQNAFQGESRDEVQQLRDENATFRHENDLLRTKLVENKVVAGGQYRAASASTVARAPLAPSSVCTKCSTARTKAIKAHQESEQAQAATVELREYVAKIEASQQRLWEDRSSHVNEIAKLREKLAEKVEQCLLIEAECIKLDNQVRRLQSENDITKFTQPLVEKEVVDNATQCALQQSCDEESSADQLCEMAGLKAEVQF